MYHAFDLASLRTRARYDRGVQYSTPVALVVTDAAGAAHRAAYVGLHYGTITSRLRAAKVPMRRRGRRPSYESR